MEIERKFLIRRLPENYESFPHQELEQGYLCTEPVVRIRKSNDAYTLTYKGEGLMAREEYNLPLNKESYEHLRKKADGNIISKTRYLIPIEKPDFSPDIPLSEQEANVSLKIELDIFDAPFRPLIIAEVEFPTENAANAFLPPAWFDEDVTRNPDYHNSNLSRRIF